MNKFKKYIAATTAVIAVFSHASADGLRLMVNGRYETCDPAPIIENDMTYLSARSVADIMAADSIVWNGDDRSVTISLDGMEIQLGIGSEYASVDGASLYIGAKPIIHNDRTYLPLRFVAETFGAKVGWDSPTRTVIMFTSLPDESSYTDLDWLAKIVYAEAGSEPYEGKLAVANIILNRVKSSSFPDSIRSVIFEEHNGIYQFTPVKNCYIYCDPNKESIAAAQAAISGENNIDDCLYFVGAAGAENSWAANNCEFVMQIGNHLFYR